MGWYCTGNMNKLVCHDSLHREVLGMHKNAVGAVALGQGEGQWVLLLV